MITKISIGQVTLYGVWKADISEKSSKECRARSTSHQNESMVSRTKVNPVPNIRTTDQSKLEDLQMTKKKM